MGWTLELIGWIKQIDLPISVRASSNPVKAWREQKGWAREVLSLCLMVWNWNIDLLVLRPSDSNSDWNLHHWPSWLMGLQTADLGTSPINQFLTINLFVWILFVLFLWRTLTNVVIHGAWPLKSKALRDSGRKVGKKEGTNNHCHFRLLHKNFWYWLHSIYKSSVSRHLLNSKQLWEKINLVKMLNGN